MLFSIIMLLLPVSTFGESSNVGTAPGYELDVLIDPSSSRIRGISKISVSRGKSFSLDLGKLRIHKLTLNGKPLDYTENHHVVEIESEEDGILEIRYEAVLKPMGSPDPVEPASIGDIITNRGVSLTGLWYPQVSALTMYRLRATLPEGYEAISEAEHITSTVKEGKVTFLFEFSHPLDRINLVASDRYRVSRHEFNGIEIYSYFFDEDSGLADTYIEYTKKYLALYEGIVGRYPYQRFSIVENVLPTGFSMPTFTLLGRSVVRLPFIVETSLGHEILHQWFGGYVYIDDTGGNWAEGLTTYLADHLYREQIGSGWEYRKQILVNYMYYVTEDNEFPIRKFRRRFDHASKSIGYGKTAMVFHMLKNMLGENKFHAALGHFIDRYRYEEASWRELRSSFEELYGKELDNYFRQWLENPGLPELIVSEASLLPYEGGYELAFSVRQKGDVYVLDFPVTVYSGQRVMKRFFRIAEETAAFRMFMSVKPDRVVFDEDYDIARSLHEDELPPAIAGILDGKELIISISASEETRYGDIVEKYMNAGAEVKRWGDISYSDLKSSNLIILGYGNPMIAQLFGKIDPPDAGFSISMKKNPWNPRKVVAILHGTSTEEISAGFRKIPHYGKYSEVFFEAGRKTHASVGESQRGIVLAAQESVPAVDLSALNTIDSVIENASQTKIIYVGEFHDVFSHHAVQLDIIKNLFQRNRKIAIGMEMFQRPFQKTLDDFSAGVIDERELLRRTEYYERWRFDYRLYQPILRFARLNGIPVVALNMDRNIIDTVSDGGLDSLNEDERSRIPADMDFSDSAYRERLREVFMHHPEWEKKNFDFFYQSQILWDETMSLSIDDFIRKNPEKQIVVIAGQGHLQFGSGIPERTFRRNGENYAIILIDATIEKGIADYVLFPKHVEGVTSPKLMVFLDSDEGDLKISGFPDKSISEKAGMQAGDIIMSLDGNEVRSIEDVKIYLLYKRRDDVVRVKVLREEDGRQEEIEYKVRL